MKKKDIKLVFKGADEASWQELLDDLRLKGKWINHRNDYGHNIADCSLCGKAMQWHDEDEDGVPRFCWYCGADMRGGKETTFDDYLKEQLKDPEFRKEWEKLERSEEDNDGRSLDEH